jgi:hypothetical protein
MVGQAKRVKKDEITLDFIPIYDILIGNYIIKED